MRFGFYTSLSLTAILASESRAISSMPSRGGGLTFTQTDADDQDMTRLTQILEDTPSINLAEIESESESESDSESGSESEGDSLAQINKEDFDGNETNDDEYDIDGSERHAQIDKKDDIDGDETHDDSDDLDGSERHA